MHFTYHKEKKKHTFHTYFFNDQRPHMYRTLNKFLFIEMKYTIREDVIEIFQTNTDTNNTQEKKKTEVRDSSMNI